MAYPEHHQEQMPCALWRDNMEKTEVLVLPVSFAGVQKLPAKRLNALCVKYSIATKKLSKLPRKHLLCQALGISTCGTNASSSTVGPFMIMLSSEEKNHLSNLTMLTIHQLQGWMTTLTTMPPINEVQVTQYLVKNEVIPEHHERAYKLSRPFKMMEFVHFLAICTGSNDRFAFLQAQVNPSQSTNRDDVKLCFAILDKQLGMPFDGHCVCTAGYVFGYDQFNSCRPDDTCQNWASIGQVLANSRVILVQFQHV